MPPNLSGQPLAQLKQWLAIAAPADDALLTRLLEAAWQLCQQFTGHAVTDWADLPEALRHGIIRHAAHHYRERDNDPAAQPPAAVAALWRPWRALRL